MPHSMFIPFLSLDLRFMIDVNYMISGFPLRFTAGTRKGPYTPDRFPILL